VLTEVQYIITFTITHNTLLYSHILLGDVSSLNVDHHQAITQEHENVCRNSVCHKIGDLFF